MAAPHKKGALLVNLGSPDSTSIKDIKRYLGEFLMDKRVIDIPYLLRLFLVKGIILNTRPKKTAAAYKKIWWDEGSPLVVISKSILKKVQQQVSLPVALAMRYGKPSIKNGLQELYDKGVRDICLVPLYPQHAMATTETILVLAESLQKKHFPDLKLSHLPAFYHRDDYIEALGNSIRSYLADKPWEQILFSYHGIPERHIYKTDVTKGHCQINDTCCRTDSPAHAYCYRHQCYETTRQVARYLNLDENQYQVSFQSRLGNDPWLQPFTDKTIEVMPGQGVKKLAVVMPAFVSDCLETLEEIAMEGKQAFMDAGGTDFHAVPCLNDNEAWAAVLTKWINES